MAQLEEDYAPVVVNYKFNSWIDYKVCEFEEKDVSIADLKIKIVARHSIKSSNILITNENSTEVYRNELFVDDGSKVTVFRTPIDLSLKRDLPEDLVCPLCKDLLHAAVRSPCCGIAFCKCCITTRLVLSYDRKCPLCNTEPVSPGKIVPNNFLRKVVNHFRCETGAFGKGRPIVAAYDDDNSENDISAMLSGLKLSGGNQKWTRA